MFSVLLISLLAGAPAPVRATGAGDQVAPGALNAIDDRVPEGHWAHGEECVHASPLQAVRSAEFAGERASGALLGTAAREPPSGVRWLGAPGGLAPGSYKESFTEGQGIVGQEPSRFVAIGQKLESVEEGGLARRGAATRPSGCSGQRSRLTAEAEAEPCRYEVRVCEVEKQDFLSGCSDSGALSSLNTTMVCVRDRAYSVPWGRPWDDLKGAGCLGRNLGVLLSKLRA